jgi:hypothetical protein
LPGILGVVVVPEKTTANAQDHRAMTTDQGGERSFVLAGDEGLQQLPIGQPGPVRR